LILAEGELEDAVDEAADTASDASLNIVDSANDAIGKGIETIKNLINGDNSTAESGKNEIRINEICIAFCAAMEMMILWFSD